MGNVEAKNAINEALNSSTSILNTTVQKCEKSLASYEGINISGCTNVTLKNIDFSQQGSIDTTCVQKAAVSANISNQVDAQMQQMAETIKRALSFNPGSSEASNIDNLSVQLSTAVKNSFTQVCVDQVVNTQEVNITCPAGGGTVDIEDLKFSQAESDISNCTQTTLSVTQVVNEIKTVIDQTSIAKEAPLISFGLILLLLLAVIIFLIVGGGESKIIIYALVFLIFAAIITYFVLAGIYHFWPFVPKSK